MLKGRRDISIFSQSRCDYTLIGEDEFAAAAYLSEDPTQKGIIFGQDITKIIASALILLGAILATFGNNVLKTLLST